MPIGAAFVVASIAGLSRQNTYILAKNPKLEFARMMRRLYPNHIEPHISIGNNVQIHESAVIGSEGFGDIRNESGEWERFPHIGGVQLDDNVRIDALTAVDRGSIGNTVIGEGTHIDNLVHIAHNVQIGKHCLVIAQAMIAGSVKIGDYTTIQPGARIASQVRIGSNVIIGMGSVVIENIPDNVVVVGVPGRILRENDESPICLQK